MTRRPAPAEIHTREPFLSQIIERLGTHPCDFPKTFDENASRGRAQRRLAAGVLVPLLFRESSPAGSSTEGTFLFQLIKRSPTVPQPGDLSFPGGMLHPLVDRMLSSLLLHGPFPILGGKARKYASLQPNTSFGLISLFLATALRESWEEIRLPPGRLRFLGPLPTYHLTLFRRTIFPVAGFVEAPVLLRPNQEVEKIVEIPLSSFFDKDSFGCYQIETGEPGKSGALQYPCLIHHDRDGNQELLWGATFKIILSFLEIVLDYRLPEWESGPLVRRSLNPAYLTGSR